MISHFWEQLPNQWALTRLAVSNKYRRLRERLRTIHLRAKALLFANAQKVGLSALLGCTLTAAEKHDLSLLDVINQYERLRGQCSYPADATNLPMRFVQDVLSDFRERRQRLQDDPGKWLPILCGHSETLKELGWSSIGDVPTVGTERM